MLSACTAPELWGLWELGSLCLGWGLLVEGLLTRKAPSGAQRLQLRNSWRVPVFLELFVDDKQREACHGGHSGSCLLEFLQWES